MTDNFNTVIFWEDNIPEHGGILAFRIYGL